MTNQQQQHKQENHCRRHSDMQTASNLSGFFEVDELLEDDLSLSSFHSACSEELIVVTSSSSTCSLTDSSTSSTPSFTDSSSCCSSSDEEEVGTADGDGANGDDDASTSTTVIPKGTTFSTTGAKTEEEEEEEEGADGDDGPSSSPTTITSGTTTSTTGADTTAIINTPSTTATTTARTKTNIRKSVSFGTLEELSFPVVEGDPNLDVPFPMTLGWDCIKESSFPSLQAYEKAQRKRRGTRQRTHEELHIEMEDRIQRINKGEKTLNQHRRKMKVLKRNNTMSNGMMFGRDKRRNGVQKFLHWLSPSNKNSISPSR